MKKKRKHKDYSHLVVKKPEDNRKVIRRAIKVLDKANPSRDCIDLTNRESFTVGNITIVRMTAKEILETFEHSDTQADGTGMVKSLIQQYTEDMPESMDGTCGTNFLAADISTGQLISANNRLRSLDTAIKKGTVQLSHIFPVVLVHNLTSVDSIEKQLNSNRKNNRSTSLEVAMKDKRIPISKNIFIPLTKSLGEVTTEIVRKRTRLHNTLKLGFVLNQTSNCEILENIRKKRPAGLDTAILYSGKNRMDDKTLYRHEPARLCRCEVNINLEKDIKTLEQLFYPLDKFCLEIGTFEPWLKNERVKDLIPTPFLNFLIVYCLNHPDPKDYIWKGQVSKETIGKLSVPRLKRALRDTPGDLIAAFEGYQNNNKDKSRTIARLLTGDPDQCGIGLDD